MINVKKASGEFEPFSEKKVRDSLKKAKIDEKLINRAIIYINGKLYNGISTSKIYAYIFDFLRREKLGLVGRYSLKRAIMDLGPTGFPFEKYIAAILKYYKYLVETNVFISGKCIKHEVDLVVQKNDRRFLVECKFHNRPGLRTDAKVALYIKSRFDDVVAQKEDLKNQVKFHLAWLVSNTLCTSDAISYAVCVGMKIIAWNYPEKESLQKLVESSSLYPITCLSTLNFYQKNQLLNQSVILCQDLLKVERKLLYSLGISGERERRMYHEIELACNQTLAPRQAISLY